jgi:two-component system chemotaxis response regulator CheY
MRRSPLETLAPERVVDAPMILVVDDDPDILDALSEILEGEGYRVRRARNGREAFERLGPVPPQLILLDLMMPVMDGWEFATRLREDDIPSSEVPIIVLSADRNVGAKARELGAVGHLSKPFELGELLHLLDTHLPNGT